MSRRILSALGRKVAARLTAAGVSVQPPDGAFYLFPDFTPFAASLRERGITTSTQLCHALLDETGVAILPGVDFGRSPAELTARLAYVDFDGARALYGADSIPIEKPLDDDYLETYCGGVLEAVDHIAQWVAIRPY
jgi:aspartate aminotransferase